jgi:hypothetical protein
VMESPVDAISVEVNGVKYSISRTSPKTSLNEWLRSQPGLKGGNFVLYPCTIHSHNHSYFFYLTDMIRN